VIRRLAVVPALLTAAIAWAQPAAQPHMEGCLVWGVIDGNVGARNECSRAFTVLFMVLDSGNKVEAEIAPGGRFNSGMAPGPTYMFTVCPVGYMPSVRFIPENKATIIDSLYNCVVGRPNA
jgi:hypothetical protein